LPLALTYKKLPIGHTTTEQSIGFVARGLADRLEVRRPG